MPRQTSVPFACKRDKESDKSHKERSLELDELWVNELGQKKHTEIDRREWAHKSKLHMLHLLLLRAHCSFCQIPVLISLACPCSSLSQSLSLSHTQALSLSLDYFQTKVRIYHWNDGLFLCIDFGSIWLHAVWDL